MLRIVAKDHQQHNFNTNAATYHSVYIYTLILYMNDIPYIIYCTQVMVLDSEDDELWNETVNVVLIITTPPVII